MKLKEPVDLNRIKNNDSKYTSDWETVLLTGTIKPNIKIRGWKYWYKWSIDVNERIMDYYISILFYITYSDFKNIVFCENSNYNFDTQITSLKKIAETCNKNLEIIQFKWNNDALQKTYYWYWEWEIINYALSKSEILQNCKNWYKITWRYIIGNINSILERNKKDDNLFFRLLFGFWLFTICTAFFKTNNITYNKYLYDINDKLKPWITLESLYYIVLKKSTIKSWKLSEIPYRIWRDSKYRNTNTYQKLAFYIWLWNYDGIMVRILENMIKLKRTIFH